MDRKEEKSGLSVKKSLVIPDLFNYLLTLLLECISLINLNWQHRQKARKKMQNLLLFLLLKGEGFIWILEAHTIYCLLACQGVPEMDFPLPSSIPLLCMSVWFMFVSRQGKRWVMLDLREMGLFLVGGLIEQELMKAFFFVKNCLLA